jgi:hypothetical protein
LDSLNANFRKLVPSNEHFLIQGKELFESNPILGQLVVGRSSTTVFFEDPVIVTDTDHSSIAQYRASENNGSHEYLRRFIETFFNNPGSK